MTKEIHESLLIAAGHQAVVEPLKLRIVLASARAVSCVSGEVPWIEATTSAAIGAPVEGADGWSVQKLIGLAINKVRAFHIPT
jgi:hypothetical protein